MKLFVTIFIAVLVTVNFSATAQLLLPVKILTGNCVYSIVAKNDTLWGLKYTPYIEAYWYSTDRGVTWLMQGEAHSAINYGKTNTGKEDSVWMINGSITALGVHDDEIFTAYSVIWAEPEFDFGGLFGEKTGHVGKTYGNIHSVLWQDSVIILQQHTDDVGNSGRLQYSSDNGKNWTGQMPGLHGIYRTSSGAARIGNITYYFVDTYQDSASANKETNVVLATDGITMSKHPINKINNHYSEFGCAFTSYKNHLLFIFNDSLFTSPDSAKTWYHIPTPRGFLPHSVAVIDDTFYVAPPEDYMCKVVGVEETYKTKQYLNAKITGENLIVKGFNVNSSLSVSIEIADISGRTIYRSGSITPQQEALSIPIDEVQLSNGVYNVIVKSSDGYLQSVKVVKYNH